MKQANTSSTVYITGLGAVTPLGGDVETFWNAVVEGKSAFAPIDLFPAHDHRTQVVSEIKHLSTPRLKRLERKTLSRADVMALAAAGEALHHARLLDPSNGTIFSPKRTGVVVGTAAGGIRGLEKFFRKRAAGRSLDESMNLLSSFSLSAIATNIAREFVIQGPRMTLATVCSSSGLALAAAKEMLETQDLDHVLVVGTEGLSEIIHAGFNCLRAVANHCCRPFDLNRKGIIFGEGAGAMILEKRSSVIERKIPFLAGFAGYGMSTDLHHFTAPQPQGISISEAICNALEDAGVGPEEIDYVNAHGTGTPLNDVAETRGIKKALGPRAYSINVSSIKSMIGHTMGASSILESITTVLALNRGVIPPTAHLDTPDPDCDLDNTPKSPLSRPIQRALSNSFAFGGSNISLVFDRENMEHGVPAFSDNTRLHTPVITGIGVVSPSGIGQDQFVKSVQAGKSGLVPLDFMGDFWKDFNGGVVDMPLIREKTPSNIRRRLNTQASFLFVSFKEALDHAGLDIGENYDTAMAYGTAFGCSGNVHRFFSQLLTDGPKFTSPFEFNMSVTNAPAALLAKEFGLKIPTWVFAGDETSWDLSLHWGAGLIQRGLADRVIVCGAEELNESIMAIHHKLELLESKNNRGLVLGEGAVTMILESAQTASERGADIYGTLAGMATVQDASCGPVDFSSSEKPVLQAASRCLKHTGKNGGRLRVLGPENGAGFTGADRLVNLYDELNHLWDSPVTRTGYRAIFGESGICSGLGLAAALLDGRAFDNILALTSARGGISAATLVQTKANNRQSG